jgi:hypothetical protein
MRLPEVMCCEDECEQEASEEKRTSGAPVASPSRARFELRTAIALGSLFASLFLEAPGAE